MRRRIHAVIFDRDGTLIKHVPYLQDPEQVSLLPGARLVIEKLRQAGILLFIHTNQSGIGRGMFSQEAALLCNQRLIELLDFDGEPFTNICIAPETPEDPPLYRKPSPKFALEIMREHNLHPSTLCYVGDRGSDLATAAVSGTRAIGVTTGLDDLSRELKEQGLFGRFPVVSSLGEALPILLGLQT